MIQKSEKGRGTRPDEDRRGRETRRGRESECLWRARETGIAHGVAGAAPQRTFLEAQLSQWLP